MFKIYNLTRKKIKVQTLGKLETKKNIKKNALRMNV